MADHFGLLVDFLGHEVAVVRLVDQRGRHAVLDDVAAHDRIGLVVDGGTVMGQHDPIAVFEIGDAVGKRPERDRVRAEIHFALAETDRQRRPVAGADHQIVIAGEDESERERAAKLRKRRPHRLDRLDALTHQVIDQMQHDLGVGLGLEDGCLSSRAPRAVRGNSR